MKCQIRFRAVLKITVTIFILVLGLTVSLDSSAKSHSCSEKKIKKDRKQFRRNIYTQLLPKYKEDGRSFIPNQDFWVLIKFDHWGNVSDSSLYTASESDELNAYVLETISYLDKVKIPKCLKEGILKKGARIQMATGLDGILYR